MSMDMNTKIKLSNGKTMPCFGLGCYNAFGDEMTNATEWALEAGYRYIDSASCYKNEDAIGKALAKSKIAREDLFILSKIWPSQYDDVEKALMETMKALQVDYLDCYLIHWPTDNQARRLKTYEQLLKLEEKGVCRMVGTSNFLPEHMEELYKNFGVYPPVNELEIHPYFQQTDARNYLRSKNIQLISYTPTNRGAFLDNAEVKNIASAHGKKPNQVILRWHIQKGLVPIPKSSNRERIKENRDIFDFELTQAEMEVLDAMECGMRRGHDPLAYNG